MKKIIGILVSIIAITFLVIRYIGHTLPYIQFENEIYSTSEKIIYRDIEIDITDISYNDEYEVPTQYDPITPAPGNTFIFITMHVTNNSDKNFNIAALAWDLVGFNEKGKEITCVNINMDANNMFSYSIAPNESKESTLVYEVSKEIESFELMYYTNSNDKASLRKPLNKAPDFKIQFKKIRR